jgi:hypothetical protein
MNLCGQTASTMTLKSGARWGSSKSGADQLFLTHRLRQPMTLPNDFILQLAGTSECCCSLMMEGRPFDVTTPQLKATNATQRN